MNETLGKRIAEHRKRLGLTQDALAEKLGITAQAVSKWENDLSCPDIAMLPRLAEIFHISVDELLGLEAPEKVHAAEIIDEDDDAHGIHIENGKGTWNFHWNSGRRHSLVFAICVLFVGALTLVARYLGWDVSFWEILWPSALLIYGINGILPRFSVFSFGIALVGGYYLLDHLHLWQWNIGSQLIFPICVVLFGIGLFLDAMRKPKKPRFHITKGHNRPTKAECTNHTDSFTCNLSFGEQTHEVDISPLNSGEINVSFGELTVDLSQCHSVTKNCSIEANCSFGSLTLLVPSCFRVEAERNAAFGSINFTGQCDDVPEGIISLEANASFGEISVCYI